MGFKDRQDLVDNILEPPDGPRSKRRREPKRRSRTRANVQSASFQTWHTTHHPPPPGGVGPQTIWFDRTVNFFTRFEQVNDIVGNRGGENPVDHVLCTSGCGSRRPFTYVKPSGSPGESGGSHFGPWEAVEFPHIHNKIPVVDQSSLGDQSLRAIQRATELFPTVVLLPNFLWELREWRDLPEVIQRLRKNWEIFDSYQRGLKSVRRYLDWSKRPDVRREFFAWLTGKRIANAFLAKQFGVDPFLQDLKKLFGILKRLDEHIKFLKSKMNKRYRVGHREELSAPAGVFTPTSLGTTTLECEYYRATVNYSFEVSHDIPELDSIRSRIGVMMVALGLNNPATVIWEAIPYSFLIDWFVDVQGLLQNLGNIPFMTGKITVHKVSTSVTQRASVSHYINVYGNSKVFLDRYNMRRYWRWPGLPTTSYVSLKGVLTDNQLLLVAALLRQRLKR